MAARKFEQKVARFLKTPKIYIKAILKSQKTYIKVFLKIKNVYIEALKIMLNTSLNRFYWQFYKSSPKSSQIVKSPKQKIGPQMARKVAQISTNRQIWQH